MESNELPKYVTLHDMAKLRCYRVDYQGNVEYNYNEGANFILGNLRKDLEAGVDINKDWVNRPIPIRRQGAILPMHAYLDGAEDMLRRIEVLVWHGGRLDMHSWIFTHKEKFLFHEECFTDMEKLKAASLHHLRSC